MTQSVDPLNLGKNTIRLWTIPNKYHKRDDYEGPNRSKKHDRRGFISGLAPACDLTCLDVKTGITWNPGQEDPAQETSGLKKRISQEPHCMPPHRICSQLVILESSMFPDRIKLFLVGEELGC